MKKKLFAAFIAIVITGCKKNQFETPVLSGVTVPVTVSIDQSQPGFPVPRSFEGLSYETGLLIQNPDFLNEDNLVLVQLIKNLGPGILRIGGDTSDEIEWTGQPRTAATGKDSLTTSDVDRLSAFSKAIGWKVLFGLNLGNNNVKAAVNEAAYVHNSLQHNLDAFQAGNEPDVFRMKQRYPKYTYNTYQQEWDKYFAAIRAKVPNAPFSGPDVIPFDPEWILAFAKNEGKNVKLIAGHYYRTGPASNDAITYHHILEPSAKLPGYLLQLRKISEHYRIPYRITEGNSVYGGGKPGVSDVFASALWALDFMWNIAENRGQGINFHGGGKRFAYTPIVMDNGLVSARPEYYAMLAFSYGAGGGSVIPATIVDPRVSNNCSVYASVKPDQTYTVTLVNKEDSKNFAFTIQLSKTASSIQVFRLEAPSITSTTGTTFAGSTVNSDGTFDPLSTGRITVNSKNFVVNVPAGSAAVVTVH
ncbi:glycosyl hydrolase family 79 C-terminal domain-containing protein [soil metagenome]|jgi:hypothetical protein